jgi:5-formyltetrahydrofolate cyclo-ligase
MKTRISIPLDDEVREALRAEARYRQIALSTLLGEIAAEAAARLRRERIREQSKKVGAYVAASPEAAAFYRDWSAGR